MPECPYNMTCGNMRKSGQLSLNGTFDSMTPTDEFNMVRDLFEDWMLSEDIDIMNIADIVTFEVHGFGHHYSTRDLLYRIIRAQRGRHKIDLDKCLSDTR